jgi:F-type H+-transporting ATPase subunit a
MLNISIKAEPIFQLLGFTVTNSLLTSVIVLILLFFVAKFYSDQITKKQKNVFFYFIQTLMSQIHDLFKGILGANIDVFFPFVGAFFLYILLQNWFGLLPGIGSLLVKVNENGELHSVPLFRGASADLNTTLALGLVSVIAVQFYGVKYLGWGGYLKKYINFSNPINFLLGILEVISEVSRVISFSFRLFGNIFAGEVLLLVIAFLIPFFISFPFFLMEIFVGFVQALVFAMLTAVFLSIAVAKEH